MKLLIDIPEEEYERFKKNQKKEYSESMLDVNIIANGTPIPDDNATNGEVFGKIMDCMFMDNAYIATDKHGYLHLRGVKEDWWNAPYQKGGKE